MAELYHKMKLLREEMEAQIPQEAGLQLNRIQKKRVNKGTDKTDTIELKKRKSSKSLNKYKGRVGMSANLNKPLFKTKIDMLAQCEGGKIAKVTREKSCECPNNESHEII